MLTKPLRPRAGIILLEVIVLLAIFFLLLSYFSAGLGHSREVQDRFRCRSNLKVIGLALHNYHECFGSFPAGYLNDVSLSGNGSVGANGAGNDGTGGREVSPGRELFGATAANGESPQGANGRYSWMMAIVPFGEPSEQAWARSFSSLSAQDVLQDTDRYALLTDSGISSRSGNMACEPNWFTCPSSELPKLNSFWTFSNGNGPVPWLSSSYVGVNGSFLLAKTRPQSASAPGFGILANGSFYENSRVGFKDMTDGSSNILMVGERVFQYQLKNGPPLICGASVLGMINGDLAHANSAETRAGGLLVERNTSNQIGLAYGLGAINHAFNSLGEPVNWFGPTEKHPAGGPVNEVITHPNLNYHPGAVKFPDYRHAGETTCRTGFSSHHVSNGKSETHFLTGDGAVRTFNSQVDFNPSPKVDSLLEYLMGISDGNLCNWK